MSILDKRNSEMALISPCSLELGCGPTKRHKDAIGIDALDYPGVDIVGDVFECLSIFEDKSVDAIYSYHFLEHIEQFDRLISELVRCLKPGGLLEAVVPHFSNPFFYSDPTHKQEFGLYTFSYFSQDLIHKRRVPSYKIKQELVLDSAYISFKSYPPHYVRHGVKKFIEMLVNASTWGREFYEENLSGVLPSYEITFRLHKQNL